MTLEFNLSTIIISFLKIQYFKNENSLKPTGIPIKYIYSDITTHYMNASN